MDWKTKSNTSLNWSNQSTSTKWTDNTATQFNFYGPYWVYHEYLTEHFATGTLENLFAKDNTLTFPKEYGWCFGPATIGDTTEIDQEKFSPYTERLWVVWKNNADQIWIAKSDRGFTYFEWTKQLLFVPSGANNPAISFDKSGNYVLAVDLIPPGATKSEIWLMSYPYKDDAITKTTYGSYPKLFLDHTKDVLLFYQDTISENTLIKYRGNSEKYATEHILPITADGIKTICSIRFYYYGPEVKKDFNLAALIIYKLEKSTRYLSTSPLLIRPIKLLGTVKDEVGAVMSILGITWTFVPSTIYVSKQLADKVGVFCGLTKITWKPIIFETYKFSENPIGGYTSIQNIEWHEITFVSKQLTDEVGANIGILSILWVQGEN